MLLLCSTTFPLFYDTTKSANELASVMNRSSDGLSFLDHQLKLNSRDDAESVAAAIEVCPRLLFLELRGNTLGIEAGKRLAEALEKHPELKFALWSDLFTGRLKTEIPIIVRGLCSSMIRAGAALTELDLSDNAFGPIGAESIQEFLCSPSALDLKVLRLNNCGMGAGGITIANCLLKAHENAAAAGRRFQLKTFVAGRNRLEDPGATALAAAFKKIGTLEEITIHQNGIRQAGIKAMAECLSFNKNLRIINFNDNTATRNGAMAIAFALGDLQQLEQLDLGDCLCRANGTTAILSVLVSKPFPKLQSVTFTGNELPSTVIRDVLSAWINCKPGVKLNASYNGYGDDFEDLKEEIEERGLSEMVDIGSQSDDEGTADEESEGDGEDEEEETDEDEKKSRADSEDMAAGDALAGAMAGLGVQQQPVAAVAAAATLSAAPAASSAPFELSFLNQQQKWESAADAESVAAALEAHPEVTSFVLRGNTLGVEAGERIAKALEKCPKMKDCNWSDLFTGRLRSEIPIIVKRLCGAMRKAGVQLRLLDLSDNAFGPIGAESIQEFLESESAFSLEELHLNNCGLGAGAVTVANSLLTLHKKAKAAGKKLNLRVIVAGRNRLEIAGALAFAKAIGEIGTLEELTVHQNGIHRPGVIGLAEGVSKNLKMKRLSIADNVGGWEGAIAFAKAITNLRSLESADFSDCLSKNKGCRRLVQAAVRLPLLKVLNLSGSELTSSVGEEVLKLWSQGRKDEARLIIGTNSFSDEFEYLRVLADQLGGTVDVGESDDDCGSLSGEESDDEDEEGGVEKSEEEDVDVEGLTGEDETSDGEKYSDEDEDYDDEEDDYYEESDEGAEDETELEKSTDSAKENSGPALSIGVPPSLSHIIPSFCAAPTAEGLRNLSKMSSDKLRVLFEPFVSTRDQTQSARLFLSIVKVASASGSLEEAAVDVIDVLVTEVAKHPRKPIPTSVQLMNHVVAHVDKNIKREETLIDPSSISRPMLERLLRELMERGRLNEAAMMMKHYFPSLNAAAPTTAAAAAAPKQTFSFSFGAPTAAPAAGTPLMPKFNFGSK